MYHGSYLFLFIVVSRVLNVVYVLKLLICPRTKLCSYYSSRHCLSLYCFYSFRGLSGRRTQVKIFMFPSLAYILPFNITVVTSKHQRSVMLENQWPFNERYLAHLNVLHLAIIHLIVSILQETDILIELYLVTLFIFDKNKSIQDILFTRLCFIFIHFEAGWSLIRSG